jgi:hypothetical protein
VQGRVTATELPYRTGREEAQSYHHNVVGPQGYTRTWREETQGYFHSIGPHGYLTHHDRESKVTATDRVTPRIE